MKKNIKLVDLLIFTLAGLSIGFIAFSYFMPKQLLAILPNLSTNLLNTPALNNTVLNSQVLANHNPELSKIEQNIHNQINQYRKSIGLNSLIWHETISEQSRIHSANMANGKLPLGHDQFQQRAEIIGAKIAYSQVAENVAFNYGYADSATQAVEGWLKSPGHKKNIEGKFNLAGVGVVKNIKGEYYFTQIFVLSR
ncbi:MAG: CAP domain-containing protein [Microcoleaceae cyanobacterium]